MKKQTTRFILSGVLTLGLLWLAFRGTDIAVVLKAMRRANHWWILAMFFCLVASHVVRAWRWRYLLEPLKPNIGIRNLTSGVMVGYMMNNVLPRAGELVRPYTIGMLEGIPKSAAFGTIVVERLIDGIAFLVMIAILPLVYSGPLRESFPWLEDARIGISIVTVGGIAFLLALGIRRDWAEAVITVVSKVLPHRFGERVSRLFHQFLDGFLFLKHPRRLPLIVAQSAAIWFLYICMMYGAFFAFDLGLDFGAAIVVQAISTIGVAVPTPGGTGSYHVLATQSLNKLFDVPKEIALSYATLTHGVGFVGITLIGLYFFFKDHINVSDAVQLPPEQRT
jgi:hypothetical protein